MATVCPCITARTEDYTKQLNAVVPFASRLHIDVADGVFSPTELIPPQNLHWPAELKADIHVMYQHPLEIVETLVALRPNLVILHAESDGVDESLRHFSSLGIRCGLAILAETPVDAITPSLHMINHVLIFSGSLGYFGGKADLKLLQKAAEIKQLSPEIEIGWDGGVNSQNAAQLVTVGVQVLNVGGAIQQAEEPQKAYDEIRKAIQS